MRSRTSAIALAFWAILSIGNLAQFVHDVGGAPDSFAAGELEEKLFIETVVVNAPVSLLVAYATPVEAPSFGIGPSGIVAAWCILTLAGYIQWAILVPGIFRWVVSRGGSA